MSPLCGRHCSFLRAFRNPPSNTATYQADEYWPCEIGKCAIRITEQTHEYSRPLSASKPAAAYFWPLMLLLVLAGIIVWRSGRPFDRAGSTRTPCPEPSSARRPDARIEKTKIEHLSRGVARGGPYHDAETFARRVQLRPHRDPERHRLRLHLGPARPRRHQLPRDPGRATPRA